MRTIGITLADCEEEVAVGAAKSSSYLRKNG